MVTGVQPRGSSRKAEPAASAPFARLGSAQLFGGGDQLFELMVDLGPVQQLQGLAVPEQPFAAFGVAAQDRLARVLAEQVLLAGRSVSLSFQAGEHQQVIGRMFCQMAEMRAHLQAEYALLVIGRREIESEKKLVDGGAVEWIHGVFRVTGGSH